MIGPLMTDTSATTTPTPQATTKRRPFLPPTPDEVRPHPKPLNPVLAYLTFTAIYVVVFMDWPGWISGSDGPDPDESLFLPTSLDPDEFWPPTLIQWIAHVVMSLVALGVVALVVWRRKLRLTDIGIRPSWTRTRDRAESKHWRSQAARVFWLVLIAYFAATVLRSVILALTPEGLGADAALSAGGVEGHVAQALMTLPMAFTTSWFEEALNVGVLVILLGAAHRFPAEVYTIAVAAKVGYHLYFGLGGLAVAIPALVCVWAYRRTGRLTPIILAHAVHNLAASGLTLAAAAVVASG
jgi:membrane protease YdiL (CAAX protease family)